MKSKRKTRVEVPTEWLALPKEEQERLIEDNKHTAEREVMQGLSLSAHFGNNTFEDGVKRLREYTGYFPGDNQVPDEGAWIMVTESPPTEFTVPPMSIWFATPWPMKGVRGHLIHRVRVLTPKGNLGVLPREYSRVNDMTKYYEHFGKGVEIHFLGGVNGIPPDQLFYLRSRGLPKRDAITLLLSNIRSQDVAWIETDRRIAEGTFGKEWPAKERLAA